MKLRGKRAIVTGGSRGIGRAIAEAFMQEGADVVVNYLHNLDQAKDVADQAEALGVRATALHGDLGDYESIANLVRQSAEFLGGIDILVNNAGFCHFMPFLELTTDVWEKTISVDLTGSFFCSQQVAKVMVAQGTGGRIINITSIGAYQSNATQVHYCAAKGGQELLTKGMAIELAPYGITVNSLAPGTIATDINSDFFAESGNLERYQTKIPLGRLGTPMECAGAAVFFASDDSAYVTGASLLVDGGHYSQL